MMMRSQPPSLTPPVFSPLLRSRARYTRRIAGAAGEDEDEDAHDSILSIFSLSLAHTTHARTLFAPPSHLPSGPQRLLDFVTGGCFALGGTQTKVAEGVVLFAPKGRSVKELPAAEPEPQLHLDAGRDQQEWWDGGWDEEQDFGFIA